MAIQVQRRRGTLAENNAFTGAVGELVYLTDTDQIAMHDGSAAGGFVFPNELDIIADYFGYATASGTNTITLTVLSKFSAYQAGQTFTFKAANTITGSATLNVNSKGAKTIKKKNPSAATIDTLVAGDIIAGGIYTVRYDGTDMQLIATDGSSLTPGMQLLGVVTASNSATMDFNSMITSDYIGYELEFCDLRPATDAVDLWLRTSTNNGSTFAASASDYGWSSTRHVFIHGSSQAIASADSIGDTKIQINTGVTIGDIGNAAAEGISGIIRFQNPLGTAKRKMFVFESTYITSGGSSSYSFGAGGRDSTADVDSLRLMFSTGNITSGSGRLYGKRATT